MDFDFSDQIKIKGGITGSLAELLSHLAKTDQRIIASWWQLKDFHPKLLANDFQFDEHIFQMG